MNILHYTIGLPPERSGGSVVYAHSLIKAQARRHSVFAIVCGDTLFHGSVCSFSNIKIREGFKVMKLKSPNTPTLIYGVKNPESIYCKRKIDKESIGKFIINNKIEIFHIHTFMGLPFEILEYIKSLGVKIIYTTHDYYGICLGYSMLTPEGVICDNPCAEGCARCNQHAPSEMFLRLANSSLYHFFKSFSNPKRISYCRRKKDNRFLYKKQEDEVVNRYKFLKNYYNQMFKMVDIFHFNSSQSKDIFSVYLPGTNGWVANVVTSGIRDRRKKLNINTKNVQIGFVASLAEYKGFPILKKVLIKLYECGITNWTLNAWHGGKPGIDIDCPNIHYRGKYSYSEIEQIMSQIDIVVVPSKWNETFSLVTLEAMSFGIPVIVSNHVGAKDIVRELDDQLVYNNDDSLFKLLYSFMKNPERISELNERLCSLEWVHSFENHINEIDAIYGL